METALAETASESVPVRVVAAVAMAVDAAKALAEVAGELATAV